MVDKLNEPESRFHASLLTNVFDLVDLLPRLNVNQDEELNRFAAEIKDRLCNFSAHDLKKNEILRAATATDAAQTLSQMDAVLRGREESSAEPNTSTRRMRRVSRPSSRTCRRTWRLRRHDEETYPPRSGSRRSGPWFLTGSGQQRRALSQSGVRAPLRMTPRRAMRMFRAAYRVSVFPIGRHTASGQN